MDEDVETTLDKETLQDLVSMLGSLHSEEDIETVENAGITKACFADLGNYYQAYRYIKRCIQSGKKISREYVRRKYRIRLPQSDDDPKDYANLVVTNTAIVQADEALGEMQQVLGSEREHKAEIRIDPKSFYEAAKEARNKLRDLVGPLTGPLAMIRGGKTVRYTKKGSLSKPPAQGWLVRGFVPDNWPTFFYGFGGSAKSYLAVLLALGVATGTQFLGESAVGRKVLYLDWEMDEPTFRARVNHVAKGMGVRLAEGIANLLYRRLIDPLTDDLDDIIEQVENEGIGLLIIDSFGFSMTGKDTNKQPDVTAQMARIAQIPCAVVIVDHIGKEGRGELGPFGSVYKHAAARWMWWCRAVSMEACPDGEVKPGIFVRMWNSKHNIAAQQEDVYLHIVWDDRFDPKTVRMKKVAKEEVPESLTQAINPPPKKKGKDEISATGKRILLAIKEVEASPEGIADKDWIIEDSGYSHNTVDKELEHLSDIGEIRKERVVPPKGQRRGKGATRYQYFLTTKTVAKEEAEDVSEEEANL